jgi:hypothetical protein
MTKFAYCDTKREDGVYVKYERVEEYDNLSENPKYELPGMSRDRLRGFQGGDWHFIGVRAKAVIEVVQAGTAVAYELLSPGLWGIESDSDEEYIKSVFEDECEILRNDLAMIGEHFKPKNWKWFVIEYSGMENEEACPDSYPSLQEACKAMYSAYTDGEIEEWSVRIAVDRGDGNKSYDY